MAAEYNLAENLSLIAELRGRYARIGNLKGNFRYETNFGTGPPIVEKGALYFYGSPSSFYDLDLPLMHCDFMDGDEKYTDRKARLDLSGFSLRIGMRMKIF